MQAISIVKNTPLVWSTHICTNSKSDNEIIAKKMESAQKTSTTNFLANPAFCMAAMHTCPSIKPYATVRVQANVPTTKSLGGSHGILVRVVILHLNFRIQTLVQVCASIHNA